MTVIRRKKEQQWKEPRSSDEIRCLYIEQLWDEVQRHQDIEDADLDKWLMTLSDEDREKTYVQEMIAQAAENSNQCFEGRWMDEGEFAFIHDNLFAFRMPPGFALTKATLAVFEAPDVVWAYPHVSIGLRDELLGGCLENLNLNLDEWDNHLVVVVLLVDG